MKKRSWIELDEVSSTNAYIRKNPQLWKENYLLVFTSNQTAGKGQNERVWLSQKGKDLAFSFIFHPDESVPTRHISCITLYIGLAVLRVLRKVTRLNLQIKWPNDIQYTCSSGVHKKLAGILCELLVENGKSIVLCGVGVNVNSTSFDQEIASKTTSLQILAKREIPIKRLLTSLWAEIALILTDFRPPMSKKLEKEILNSFSLLGKKIIYLNDKKNKKEAVVSGIDPFGLLMVQDVEGGEVFKIDHTMWVELSNEAC